MQIVPNERHNFTENASYVYEVFEQFSCFKPSPITNEKLESRLNVSNFNKLTRTEPKKAHPKAQTSEQQHGPVTIESLVAPFACTSEKYSYPLSLFIKAKQGLNLLF